MLPGAKLTGQVVVSFHTDGIGFPEDLVDPAGGRSDYYYMMLLVSKRRDPTPRRWCRA